MFRFLKEFFSLLTSEQRKRLLRLQVLVLFMAFAEVASVISMGPFMAVVGNMSLLQGDGRIARLYEWTGVSSPQAFLILLGLSVLALLLIAAVFSMFALWQLMVYGAMTGAELSERLFDHYLHQSWLFHSGGASSMLTKQIAQETARVTNGIIIPLMQMNAKLAVALSILCAIFLYNPGVAIVGAFIFATTYGVLYKTVRRKLSDNGSTISKNQAERFKLMSEAFGGIKDVLVLGRQETFSYRFNGATRRFAMAFGVTQTLTQAPRYAIEAVAYSLVIALVLYLLSVYQGDVETILSILAVYALAGFKMLPALQNSYQMLAQVRGNTAALDAIREDLRRSAKNANEPSGCEFGVTKSEASAAPMTVESEICLSGVTFCYPGKSVPALKNVDLKIPSKGVVGLVGVTGSGKSTTVDLLLGLIEPDSGLLCVDGHRIDRTNLRAWQNAVGYVPQSIFLADASIRENIAFGLPRSRIDESKVYHAVKLAHLEDLVVDLSDGLDTQVGERGVQLSGGQRQRIGIARALYNNAEVLIFDEATSALDGVTEKRIMKGIHEFAGAKTIVLIAHRLSTVRKCSRIYLLERGRVADSGTYDELTSRNESFRNMAAYSM